MKIAILINDTTYTYNLRREIIQRFIEEGHEVYIAAEILLFEDKLKEMGCHLIAVQVGRRGTNPLSDLGLLLAYRKILKKLKPDAVLTYNIKPTSYGGMVCGMLHIPYYPNITGLGTPIENPGKIQKVAIALYKMGVSRAECVFFQNSENLQFFQSHGMLLPGRRYRLLPGSGVNLKTYPLLPYPEGEKARFLFVARIMKEKGIDLFLAAARQIMQERDDCEFHICGMCDDPKYMETLNREQENGNIVYHGQQKDMLPHYQSCSCLLYPSYYPEGMSNVLLEAAASGRPLIVADRSGCRDIVDNEVTGYIVPVNDEKATIEAARRFLRLSPEERKEMGIRGRNKVEKEFDRELVVNAYMEEVCGTGSAENRSSEKV